MLEKEIEKKVCDYAKSVGFLVYKFSSPNHVGVPDRLFLSPYQHAFWIEFKKGGGQMTPVQLRECRKIRGCGFDVYLVDSVEDGKALIDEQMEIAVSKMEAYVIGKKMIDQTEQEESTGETRH